MSLEYLSASALAELVAGREVSSEELVALFVERIERLEPEVNAYITVAPEAALAEARSRDAELAAGQRRGPLHGVPLALKDLFDTKGMRTTAGSRILRDRVPDRDATTVAKLRAAGAVIIGKTNLNEFAAGGTTENLTFGDTLNPWDRSRIPGGSSGGSGTAVAAGLCAAATGTDTGGSIRIPSALCGVVGLKPTFGRISCHGIFPLSMEQDHPGPMTRTVRDAALLLEVMSGWDRADPRTVRRPVQRYTQRLSKDVRGLRIGVDEGYINEGVTPEVRGAFDRAVDVLLDLGARLVEVEVPDVSEAREASLVIWRTEGALQHEEWLETRPEDYNPGVRERFEKGLEISGIDYARAQKTRRSVTRAFEMIFDEVDVLATPTCGIPAPRAGQDVVDAAGEDLNVLTALARFTRVFNLTGLPAITVPCGFSDDGLPIGLQFVGAALDETTILRAAYAYESATTWSRRKPPVD